MKIRTQTMLAMTVVIILLSIGSYWITAVESRRVAAEQERIDVASNLERASAALAARILGLQATAADWGLWTSSYSFVKDHNQAFIDENLQGNALEALRADFVAYADAQGRVVYARTLDRDSSGPAALPSGLRAYLAGQPPMLHQKGVDDAVSGILDTSDGAVALAAQPISTSDRKSPSNGTFLVGYFIGQAQASEVSGLVRAPIKITPVHAVTAALRSSVIDRLLSSEQPMVTPRDSKTVDGFGLVSGIDGKPALLLQVTMPRAAVLVAEDSVRRSALWAVALFAGLLVALNLVIDRMVLRRLDTLSHDVEDVGRGADPHARLPEGGRDEIAVVAHSFNTTLEQLEQSEYLAMHDSLTGLHNRKYFEDALEAGLAEAERTGDSGSVVWMDLDHFKEVNDSLGHGIGDQLLEQFAELLQRNVRSYAAVARLGGDEFAVLLTRTSAPEALSVAQRILAAISNQTYELEGHAIRIGASAGVVMFPDHGCSVDDILARADLAMYAAKDNGRNGVWAYSEDDDTQQAMTRSIEGAERVRDAVADGRLVLHAQPTVRLSDGTRGPFELLLRMLDRDGRLVNPGEFIPVAEHLGIIRDVDRWVALRAIAMLAHEQESGRGTVFSVNLSGLAFSDHDLLTALRSELERTRIRTSNLIFEITETSAIRDFAKARRFMRELRGLGCQFSLDDFGTGMSSFHYLRQLPVDFLKIDGSLITNLAVNDEDRHFVRAIVEMCRGLGIATVAEYVESEELLQTVRSMGIDYAQGFHIAKPAPWSPEAAESDAAPFRLLLQAPNPVE